MDIYTKSTTIPVNINSNSLVFVFTDNYLNNSQGDDVEKHYHSFFELHYYLKGKGKVIIEDKELAFEPYDLFIISPNSYHNQQNDDNLEILKYIFKFSVSNISNKYDNIIIPLIDTISDNKYLLLKGHMEIDSMLENINTELLDEKKGYVVLISNYLSILLVILARSCHTVAYNKKAAGKKMKISTQTATIIDNFFDQNYNKSVKCEDLCELVHLSSSQLSRIIKELYSMSFKEKHVQTRINYIQHLLDKTNLSVTEIAEKSGFDSISSFSNYFKRYVRISPIEYRKRKLIL
jgi:AraC-like DNA-binding protein